MDDRSRVLEQMGFSRPENRRNVVPKPKPESDSESNSDSESSSSSDSSSDSNSDSDSDSDDSAADLRFDHAFADVPGEEHDHAGRVGDEGFIEDNNSRWQRIPEEMQRMIVLQMERNREMREQILRNEREEEQENEFMAEN